MTLPSWEELSPESRQLVKDHLEAIAAADAQVTAAKQLTEQPPWSTRIPAAIKKAEGWHDRGPPPACSGHNEGPVFEQHTTECRQWYDDGRRANTVTAGEVALAKGYWDLYCCMPINPLQEESERCPLELRAFCRKVEKLT